MTLYFTTPDLLHVALDIRILLAGVLLTAAALKLYVRDVDSSVLFLQALSGRTRPAHLVISRALPLFEALMGVWLLSRWFGALALASTGVLFLLFALALALALKRGYEGSCACFGRMDTPADLGKVTMNLILALSATATAGLEWRAATAIRYADLTGADFVFLGSSALAVWLAPVCFRELSRVFMLTKQIRAERG